MSALKIHKFDLETNDILCTVSTYSWITAVINWNHVDCRNCLKTASEEVMAARRAYRYKHLNTSLTDRVIQVFDRTD